MMQELLASQPSALNFLIFFIQAVIILFVVLGFVTYVILAERKVLGFMQSRYGPNRVGGRLGLLQSFADILKLLVKEDIIPSKVDKKLFILAPGLAIVPAIMVLAVLPFTENYQFADLGIGLLYYIAISGITTLGLLLAGWASNNKYALLGGARAAAQMISYEIPLVMSLIGVVMLTGSMNLNDIVNAQENVAFAFTQPIAFIVFLIAALAELNRVPFDLPESENELVAGFQTEYGGFRWAMFYLAEYVYAFAMSALAVVLFLGGWKPLFPFLDFIPGAVWFGLKFALMVFGLNWIRATWPRVRPDHLMEFAWKVLLPISLANIFLTAIIKEIINLF